MASQECGEMWGSQSVLAGAPVFFHHWCHLCWAIPAKSGSVTRLGVRQAPRPVPRAGGGTGSLCPLRLRHQGYAQQQPPNNLIITGQRGGWVLQLQSRCLSSPNAWPRKQARGVWAQAHGLLFSRRPDVTLDMLAPHAQTFRLSQKCWHFRLL